MSYTKNPFPTFSEARQALEWLTAVKEWVVAWRREYSLVAYTDVVGWLREQRGAGARGGAAIREVGADGLVVVTVVALDAQECLLVDADGRPLAVEMMAPALDEELTQAFGDASVVLFK